MRYMTQIKPNNSLNNYGQFLATCCELGNTFSIEERIAKVQELYEDDPCVAIDILTPNDADYLLNHMHKNRTIKKKNLSVLDVSMKETGVSYPSMICISDSGELLDGQHRLSKLKELNINGHFVIAYNVPPLAMYFLDTNSARTPNDIFTILGKEFANEIYSSVRAVLVYGNKIPMTQKDAKKALLNKADFNISGKGVDLPLNKIEEFYDQHSFVFTSILKIYKAKRKQKISFPSPCLSVFFRAFKSGDIDLSSVERFFDIYYIGDVVGFTANENAPAVLRQELAKNSDRKGHSIEVIKYQQTEKALKYFLEGKNLVPEKIRPYSLNQYRLFPCPEFDFKEE